MGQFVPVNVPLTPGDSKWDDDELMIVALYVAPGDHVKANEPLAEVETTKITLVIDSPLAGMIKKVTVNLHDMVVPGETLMTIDAARA
ncbi:lipoyl domain-containing protein [Streptomyces sp. bgisy154]|uniref:lipoyl domain-containing protein n=1 Tax=Streptomyces sp. bgisy154 TaxID=3413794 RepID=UPI003D70CFF7